MHHLCVLSGPSLHQHMWNWGGGGSAGWDFFFFQMLTAYQHWAALLCCQVPDIQKWTSKAGVGPLFTQGDGFYRQTEKHSVQPVRCQISTIPQRKITLFFVDYLEVQHLYLIQKIDIWGHLRLIKTCFRSFCGTQLSNQHTYWWIKLTLMHTESGHCENCF